MVNFFFLVFEENEILIDCLKLNPYISSGKSKDEEQQIVWNVKQNQIPFHSFFNSTLWYWNIFSLNFYIHFILFSSDINIKLFISNTLNIPNWTNERTNDGKIEYALSYVLRKWMISHIHRAHLAHQYIRFRNIFLTANHQPSFNMLMKVFLDGHFVRKISFL